MDKKLLSTTITNPNYSWLSHRSKCKCHFIHCSNWNTTQLGSLCDWSFSCPCPNIEPSFKVTKIFSFCHVHPNTRSTGPAKHFYTYHGAHYDLNCLISCSTPVCKHLHSLRFPILSGFSLSLLPVCMSKSNKAGPKLYQSCGTCTWKHQSGVWESAKEEVQRQRGGKLDREK